VTSRMAVHKDRLDQPKPPLGAILRDSSSRDKVTSSRRAPWVGLGRTSYLVLGNPRSTTLVAGSGHRDVTTFWRV
jgi:hypothetical protein